MDDSSSSRAIGDPGGPAVDVGKMTPGRLTRSSAKRAQEQAQAQAQLERAASSSPTATTKGTAAAKGQSVGSPSATAALPPTAAAAPQSVNVKSKLTAPQQQQQQQQHYQFRAPQQFVRYRKSSMGGGALSKKNKAWNKRQQQKSLKQMQQQQQQLQQQQQQQQQQGVNIASSGICGSVTGSIGGGSGGVGGPLPAASAVVTKADLENIQNPKIGGHYYHHHHNHHHHHHHHPVGGGRGGGVVAEGRSSSVNSSSSGGSSGAGGSSSVAGCCGGGGGGGGPDKLGYGHGHGLKQPPYKKMLVHRGHHHHVLCAGAPHNNGSSLSCCPVNGCCAACSVPNGKDSSSINCSAPACGTNGGGGGGSGVNPNFNCGRAKFFLPDKRPRKEVIIPPTKFLLGGNISDPLNLNSLQNEEASNNNTPATTPRRSPITTPPKVEVIIPPNIHDPLHLLDPVDSMEYEKQLTSPMKRARGLSLSSCGGGGSLSHLQVHHHHSKHHRHRKNRKPKRRRHESHNSSVMAVGSGGSSSGAGGCGTLDIGDTSPLASSSMSTEGRAPSSLSVSMPLESSSTGSNTTNNNNNNTNTTAGVVSIERTGESDVISPVPMGSTHEERVERNTPASLSPQGGVAAVAVAVSTVVVAAVAPTASAQQHVGSGGEALSAVDRLPQTTSHERPNRLELNLTSASVSASSSTCGSVAGSSSSFGGGTAGARKRKISESNNSQKNKKFFRSDPMDKIVSPVVPQPGAWKRPPRLAATGARKPNRRSTSMSETEQLSPVDEVAKSLHLEADRLRVETPDFNKMEIPEAGGASPVSTISGATSVAAGDPDSLADTSGGDISNAMSMTSTADSSAVSASAPVGAATTTSTPATSAITGGANTVAVTPHQSHQPPPQTALAQLTKLPKFRPDGEKYRYGNYDRYSGLRHLNEFMDVRLQVFQRHMELFRNKDILDIGCNVGHMTITVARNLGPKSILGIDIDKNLVARARRNLSMFVRIPCDASKTVPSEVMRRMAPMLSVDIKKEEKDPSASVVKKEEPDIGQSADQKVEPSSAIGSNAARTETKTKKTRRAKRKRNHHPQQQQQHQQQHQLQTAVAHAHFMHHHHHMWHHHQLRLRQRQQQTMHVDGRKFFPVSFPITYGGIPPPAIHHDHHPLTLTATPSGSGSGEAPTSSQCVQSPQTPSRQTQRNTQNSFPNNVFFRQTNYVLKDESQLCNDSQQYDLILCLSVTKWIHLNFGDAGLKLAFKRMFNQLRPGGKLILEAQNWASYKKKKNLTKETYQNYLSIEFFPNKFHEYLLSSEVGFSHSYTLGVPKHMNKGFSRPIQLYAKGDYTPNHVRWSDAYCPQTPFEAYRGIYATMPPRPLCLSLRKSSTRSQNYDTPHYTPLYSGEGSGPYSCRQTPMHQPTSQYYNPLETDSYQPSYDMEYLNHMYVFASPLYQTVWSPPASMRKSSSHTPLFGSVREAEFDGDGGGSSGGGSYHRHVYPPNEDTSSPSGAFNSIRDPDTDDSNPASGVGGRVRHVYATNCGESSLSPQVQHHHDAEMIEEGLMLDVEEPAVCAVPSVDLNEP